MPAKQNRVFSYQLISQVKNISALTLAFNIWCKDMLIPVKAVNELTLVIDELLTNIIEHGYRGEANKKIELNAQLEKHCVALTVRDYAFPFNPCQVTAANTAQSLESRNIGGLGLHFVKSKISSMIYEQINRDGRHHANQLKIHKCWADETLINDSSQRQKPS
jgi:serine/threonine-protein kinase RsbW